jgi:hypothetical protein
MKGQKAPADSFSLVFADAGPIILLSTYITKDG